MQKNNLSVIIPTLNAHAELDLAITSLLENSDMKNEIIVIVDKDPKSNKYEDKVISVINKHNLKLIKNSENLGPYGSWNKGAGIASNEFVVFATDDQYFAPHWDTSLMEVYKPKTLVSGRLVEPGILDVFPGNIKKNFGHSPDTFKKEEFDSWTITKKTTGTKEGGFFIPMLQNKKDFFSLGQYPTTKDFGTSEATSNDIIFTENAKKKGFKHITALSSYSYHFQASSWKKKDMNTKIAAVVLTYNSARTLKKTLESLDFVNEIILVDSGSTDETLEIGKEFGLQILKKEFTNFADQRNFALINTRDYDWVLMLDSDETLEDSLKKELISFSKDIYLDAVDIPRKNYIFGKWIKHSDWYPDLRRVFFRPNSVKFKGLAHERAVFIDNASRSARASSHILHDNYSSISEFIEKNLLRYPKIYAKDLSDSNVKFSPSSLVAEPLKEFMRRFFLSEGYRDGAYGLVLALLMSAQSIATYSYLWELQGKKSDLTNNDIKGIISELKTKSSEFKYWILTMNINNSTGALKALKRIRRKLLKIFSKI